ncbi:MAG: CPBP family intramembrane glutamic endopeptidase [Woeseiaceae bacterium]
MPRRWSTIVAILVVEAFVLVLRAMWELRLRQGGYDIAVARDVSYLVVPPLLALMLAPVLRQQRALLERLFDPRRVACAAATGFAVGSLSRLAWWCAVVVLGTVGGKGTMAPAEFAMSWGCPAPASLLLALLVWTCLIPLVEETLGRGLIQSLLLHRGRGFAIAGSAVAFAVYHPPHAMLTALLMGLVFACLRANSGSLWPPLAAHAAYDGLGVVDWRCLHVQWQPGTGGSAWLTLTLPALLALVLLSGAIISLVAGVGPGPRKAARADDGSKGVGHAFDDV